MPVSFSHVAKHGEFQGHPKLVYSFKDKGAEDYFVKAGLATKAAKGAAVDVTVPEGAIEIDPETVFGGGDKAGQKVLS